MAPRGLPQATHEPLQKPVLKPPPDLHSAEAPLHPPLPANHVVSIAPYRLWSHTPPLLRRSARRSKGKPDETPTSRQPDVQPSGIWDPDILHNLVRLFPILHGASAIVFCLKTPCSFSAWQNQPACLPACLPGKLPCSCGHRCQPRESHTHPPLGRILIFLEQQCSWCTLTRIPRLSDSESAPPPPALPRTGRSNSINSTRN
ncbi:hypothetical protein E4U52_002829 [Claviceps spartinae]|nr:hypothetical protein E4U52_002829 [Claviceps spartinae]